MKWVKVRVDRVVKKTATSITVDFGPGYDDWFFIRKEHVVNFDIYGVNDRDFIMTISEKAAKEIGIGG